MSAARRLFMITSFIAVACETSSCFTDSAIALVAAAVDGA
jgi:hypothetical protein